MPTLPPPKLDWMQNLESAGGQTPTQTNLPVGDMSPPTQSPVVSKNITVKPREVQSPRTGDHVQFLSRERIPVPPDREKWSRNTTPGFVGPPSPPANVRAAKAELEEGRRLPRGVTPIGTQDELPLTEGVIPGLEDGPEPIKGTNALDPEEFMPGYDTRAYGDPDVLAGEKPGQAYGEALGSGMLDPSKPDGGWGDRAGKGGFNPMMLMLLASQISNIGRKKDKRDNPLMLMLLASQLRNMGRRPFMNPYTVSPTSHPQSGTWGGITQTA